jgi:hypothetical protein
VRSPSPRHPERHIHLIDLDDERGLSARSAGCARPPRASARRARRRPACPQARSTAPGRGPGVARSRGGVAPRHTDQGEPR